MIITYNALACFIGRNFEINNRNKVKATERLSSGYRINRAADDAAGLAISEKLRGQVRGLRRAAENVQDGISLCQTADGALDQVQDILVRIRELSVQAANGAVYTEDDMQKINDEVKQLKKEINRVSVDTEFNRKKIFTVPFTIDFSEEFKVVKIFDANNGDPDDPDSYGGIILSMPSAIEDTRIPWKMIDRDMVTTDSNGKTVFKEGTYTYDTGFCTLNIQCKEGSKPPEIKVVFPVNADDTGINVAGEHINWNQVFNEDDECILNHVGEEGIYYFKVGEGYASFYAPKFDSISDLANSINATNSRYNRRYVNEYTGYDFDQAIDIMDSEGSTMRVNSSLYNLLINNKDLDLRLKADETGIWIVMVKLDGTDGDTLEGSKKTWDDMGITSWDNGNYISDKKLYEYHYKNDSKDYDFKFNFTLLDETSKDSVIEGINNASFRDTLIRTNDGIEMSFTTGNGVLSGNLTYDNVDVNIYDEAALGRNFDSPTGVFSNGNIRYDAATDEIVLEFSNRTTGNTELTFRSRLMTSVETMKEKAYAYENYFLARRVQQLLSGGGPSYPTLRDLLGNDRIKEGSFEIDSRTMKTTEKMSGFYEAEELDFSGLGTDFQLYDLLGTGFNSTCATCTNHYSVVFTWGGTDRKSSDGYGYSVIDDDQQNYTLMIDINSMMSANPNLGIKTGADFTRALVNIINEAGFDFHFQQYAADGGKLYVCDNRHNALGSFDTEPYEINSCNIEMWMVDDENASSTFGLQYTYDLKHDINPVAEFIEDEHGEFVEDGAGGYKKFYYYDYYKLGGGFQDGVTAPPKRFSLSITSRETEPWSDYYDKVMENIAKQTKLDLKSTGYDYIDYVTNELPNQATVSEFDFYIEDDRGFWIQAGANARQGILLDWDGFTTYTLTIGDKNTLSQKNASELLGCVDTALSRINSLRSLFGAYTNRLEFAYANDKNAEENLQSSESKLRDADMAEEIAEFSKQSILTQAGFSLLAQANELPQGVLRLLPQ